MTKKQGTSVALVNAAGNVVLCLRDNIPSISCPGKWDLLGGHLEAGEDPLTCIRREIGEELKYKKNGKPVQLGGPVLFRMYDLPDRVEWMFWERADLDLDEIDLLEGERLEWFSPEQIASMPDGEIAFGFKPLLLEFFQQEPFADGR